MSRDIFTRIIRGDMTNPWVQQAMEWFTRIQHINHFDRDILTYPSTALIQCYEKQTGKPRLYVPVHKVYHIEALGPAPDLDGFGTAACLAQVIKSLNWDAPKDGVGELYYACTDPTIDSFCKDHGFTRMLYDTGETKVVAPPEDHKVGDILPEPERVLVDIPHYKFKVFR